MTITGQGRLIGDSGNASYIRPRRWLWGWGWQTTYPATGESNDQTIELMGLEPGTGREVPLCDELGLEWVLDREWRETPARRGGRQKGLLSITWTFVFGVREGLECFFVWSSSVLAIDIPHTPYNIVLEEDSVRGKP